MAKNGIIHQKNMKYILAICNGFFIIIFYNDFSNYIKLIYIQLKIKYYIKEKNKRTNEQTNKRTNGSFKKLRF
jgi:hypothetical protein